MNNTTIRSILFGLSLSIPVLKVESQCPDSASLHITATLYTQADGLSSTSTALFAKDSIGYVYFNGVDGNWNRFDGHNFITNGYLPSEKEKKTLYEIPANPYDPQIIWKYLSTYKDNPRGIVATIRQQYLYVAGASAVYEVNMDDQVVRKINLADYIEIDQPSGLEITMIDVYRDRILIATSNKGLLIYNRCTDRIQQFQYENQNPSSGLTNSVVWITVDTDNVIWMQTDGGLIKLEVNDQIIHTYLPSSLNPAGVCSNCDNVRTIFTKDDEHLLVGSIGGAYTFNLLTGKFSNILSPTDQQPIWNDLAVSDITEDGRGTIFLSSWARQGIMLHNDEDKKVLNLLTVADSNFASFGAIRCLYYDSRHVLWAGSDKGFLRITNLDDFRHRQYTGKVAISDQFPESPSRPAFPTCSCYAIEEDSKGNIWLGTNVGLFMYQYETGKLIHFVHEVKDASSIGDSQIRSIYISKEDDVWIGTNNGGLNHYNASTSSFTAYTTYNGLPNNSIYTIMEDRHGNLWMGTNGGLCRFNKTDHSVRNYTPRDGIQNYEFNTNAIAVTQDGLFCFGGRSGFNIFHPDSMNVELKPPPVVISKFKILDKEIPVTDEVLNLTHKENSFTFDFAALSYYRSSDQQYAYRMDGADKDWISSGNRTYTSYNNLAPGTYTFKVKAANYSGTWNEKVASMKFIIHPAWYNTWWFRIAVLLLLATGIYEFYRYRLRQLLKLQAIRNRIARDLHDEIGSTLSSISLSSTIIQNQLKGSHPEADKMLRQVSSNTDQMMEALSDIVWAIDTRNDRFDNIVNRMRALAIEILEPSNISIQFEVSEDIRDLHLDMQQRKNLYLIFKEAINNIAKYSGCEQVKVDINRQPNKTVVMHIQDNGKGFDVAELYGEGKSLSGNGIRNMKKRAEELGGTMTIDSVPGAGTNVCLTFVV
jgi:signal transduction histidine kinase/ligand-binding sensor domain-containing protein